jgi:predicted nucleotidyltransferase
MFDTSILDEAIRARRQRLAVEQAELFDCVRRTLLELREPLGIKAAYIVGSLRSPDSWWESSDIDVAVVGCSSVVLELMKELEDATGREVDVIDLDRHPSSQSFTQSGVKVYG